MVEIVDGTSDTEAFARIATTVTRWWTFTPEAVEHERHAYPSRRDWLAIEAGTPVGAGACVEFPDMKDSTAAFGNVWVLPDARRRGIGTRLLARVGEHARRLGKSELELFAIEDDPDGISYVERRGFVVVMHLRSLRLMLAQCEHPQVRPPKGIALTTLADRPELAHQVWETAYEVMPDIPYDGDVPFTPGTFEEYSTGFLAGPDFIPQATFVALDGDHVVGFGQLCWNDRTTGRASHEMLCVRRSHRGQGIGIALKAAQIAWALDNGLTELQTGNEVRNTAARSVNAHFPYEPIPDGLLYRGPIPNG